MRYALYIGIVCMVLGYSDSGLCQSHGSFADSVRTGAGSQGSQGASRSVTVYGSAHGSLGDIYVVNPPVVKHGEERAAELNEIYWLQGRMVDHILGAVVMAPPLAMPYPYSHDSSRGRKAVWHGW